MSAAQGPLTLIIDIAIFVMWGPLALNQLNIDVTFGRIGGRKRLRRVIDSSKMRAILEGDENRLTGGLAFTTGGLLYSRLVSELPIPCSWHGMNGIEATAFVEGTAEPVFLDIHPE